jgi:hypothetical protein
MEAIIVPVDTEKKLYLQQGAPENDPKGWSQIYHKRFEPTHRVRLDDLLVELERGKCFLYTLNKDPHSPLCQTEAFAIVKLIKDLQVIWMSYLASRDMRTGHGAALMRALVPMLGRWFPNKILAWAVISFRQPGLDPKEKESRHGRHLFYERLIIDKRNIADERLKIHMSSTDYCWESEPGSEAEYFILCWVLLDSNVVVDESLIRAIIERVHQD